MIAEEKPDTGFHFGQWSWMAVAGLLVGAGLACNAWLFPEYTPNRYFAPADLMHADGNTVAGPMRLSPAWMLKTGYAYPVAAVESRATPFSYNHPFKYAKDGMTSSESGWLWTPSVDEKRHGRRSSRHSAGG